MVAILLPGLAESAVLMRYVLVAGANNGGSDRQLLRYAVSDAENFVRVLESVGGVAEEDVFLLREPSSAGLAQALIELRDLVAETEDAGVRREVVVYYSGHADDRGLLLGDDRFSYQSLRDQIDNIQADVHITVLDACASGAITRLKGGKRRQAFLGVGHVGLLPGGGAVFAWEGGASGFHRVQYRVANPNGVFLADDILVTGPDSGEQTEPSLAVLKNGNAVLSWTDYLEDGSVKGVSARVIGANGQAVTDAFRLNDFTPGNQHKSRLAALPGGGFAAVWVSDQQQDAKSLDIVVRLFSATGQPLGGEVVANAPGISANPSVALSGDSLVVAWEQLNLEQKTHRWDIGTRSFDLALKPFHQNA